jgi:hypothetical protein
MEIGVPERHFDFYSDGLLKALHSPWTQPEKPMGSPINGALRPVPVVPELGVAGRRWWKGFRPSCTRLCHGEPGSLEVV